MARGVWGLDVSKSSLKAVRLEYKKGKAELTDIDIIEYPLSPNRDERSLDEEINKALSLFSSRHNIKRDKIAVSLPSHSTFNRFIKLPPSDPSTFKDILQDEVKKHLPFEINEVIWRYQIIERAYQPGEEIDAVLFAVKKDLVENFIAKLVLGGIKIDVLQFTPVALYNYLKYQEEGLDKNIVILNVGATNTDLILVNDDKFWIRNLPVVGNDITKAVQQKFEVPFEEAEKMKVFAAQSPQAGKIFTAIQPVLKDLSGEIHRSVTYYKSLSPAGKTVSFPKMMVLGNATRVIYFDEYVTQKLQMEIVRLKKLNKIEINPHADQSSLTSQLISLGVALGLALQYFNLTLIKSNLLPDEIIKKQEIQKRKSLVTAALGICAIVLVMFYVTAYKTYSALDECYKRSEEKTKKWNADKERFDKAQQVTEIESKLNRLVENIPARDIWSKVFNALNNLPAIKSNFALPAGYIEKSDTDTLQQLEAFYKEKIWLLKLEAIDKYHDELKKQVLELTIIGGLRYRDETDNPEAYKNLIKEKLINPMLQILYVVVPPDLILLGGPVGELKTDEESPDTTSKKYYRFKVTLTIQL